MHVYIISRHLDSKEDSIHKLTTIVNRSFVSTRIYYLHWRRSARVFYSSGWDDALYYYAILYPQMNSILSGSAPVRTWLFVLSLKYEIIMYKHFPCIPRAPNCIGLSCLVYLRSICCMSPKNLLFSSFLFGPKLYSCSVSIPIYTNFAGTYA